MGRASSGERSLTEPGGPQPRGERRGPGPVARVVGRLVNDTVVRAPWLWPILRKRVGRFFDRLALGWDVRVQADAPERLAPLRAALAAMQRPPRRVLEVGTGTGVGALTIAERFPEAEVLGIDISTEMIRRAKEKAAERGRSQVRYEVADVASFDPGQCTFDLVAMLNMPPFFDQVARLVAPGGYVAWASSLGRKTPFYTSEATLRRGFERSGLRTIAAGSAGTGTYYLAERSASVE
jgi:SAM-dependent methyltransferase